MDVKTLRCIVFTYREVWQEADHSELWTGAALISWTGTHVLATLVVFPSVDD